MTLELVAWAVMVNSEKVKLYRFTPIQCGFPVQKYQQPLLVIMLIAFRIEGTHITENTSTSNMQGWNIKVINGKITNTNTNRWKQWNSVKDVLQIAGNGTPNFPLDDVYRIQGSATGSNSGGHTWAVSNCRPPD